VLFYLIGQLVQRVPQVSLLSILRHPHCQLPKQWPSPFRCHFLKIVRTSKRITG
jgi:hypothetical protein